MNGWQRLWIVLSVVLAIIIGGITYAHLRTVEMTAFAHDVNTGVLKNDLKTASERESANPGPWNYYSDKSSASVKSKMKQEDDHYKSELAGLPAERRETITWALSIWLGLCISMYVIGYAVKWVYRGFRPKKVKPL